MAARAHRPSTASTSMGPLQGRAPIPPSDAVHVLGAELAHDAAGPEERRALCRGVGEDVEQHAHHRDRRGEAHADGKDAHVLDARIGEEAFHVPADSPGTGRRARATPARRRAARCEERRVRSLRTVTW